MKRIMLLTTLFLFATPLTAQTCLDTMSETDETTRQGANLLVTNIEKKVLRKVSGFVKDANGEPVGNALVEVFDNPDWIRQDSSQSLSGRKRIIGCTVSKDGRFSISGLAKGDYELRISVGLGLNVNHTLIKIDPKNGIKGDKSDLEIYIEVGT